MHVSEILDQKGAEVATVTGSTTVGAAVAILAEKGYGPWSSPTTVWS